MAIYKSSAADKYTVVPNESARDLSLSFEATGLLCFLLSLPSDWAIHKSWLQKQKINCGRDKLTRLVAELEDAGYIKREVAQLDSGKLNGFDWYVYPTASLKNRNTVKPCDGEPATTKERSLESKDNTNLDHPTDNRALSMEEQFNKWWKYYPKKVARAKALSIWKSKTKGMDVYTMTSFSDHIISDVEFRLSDLATGSKTFIGFDMLHPTTYLNQERYNDDI